MSKPVIGSFQLYYSPPLGGAERSQHNYFKQLTEYYDIYTYCFLQGGIKFARTNEFDLDGVHVVQSARPIELAVREFINSKRPSIITTQLITSDIIVHEAFRHHTPCVFFAHGVFEDVCVHQIRPTCPHDDVLTCPNSPQCPNHKDHDRHTIKYGKCAKIICNSDFTKKVFEKIFPETSDKLEVVLPNFGYDLFQYKKERPCGKIKVFAANSSVLKGRNLITEIAASNPDIEVNYVDCRAADIGMLQSSKNINIFGKVSREEMYNYYSTSHVTVLPALLQETFSGVACESILSGTPVISTIKGNLPDLVHNNISGQLIQDLDPIEWTEHIRKWSEKRADKDFSDKLREKVTSRDNVDKIVKCFDSILGIENRIVKDFDIFSDKDDFTEVRERKKEEVKIMEEVFKKKILFFAKFFFSAPRWRGIFRFICFKTSSGKRVSV